MSSASLLFQADIAAVEAVTEAIFVDSNSDIPDNVDSYVVSENSSKNFVFISLKDLETDDATILVG